MWECPDFFPLGEQHLLLFSPQGLAAQGYRYRNRFQSGYLLGHWRPDGDFTVTQPFCELDAGHDFYAPQTFTAADGRRLLFAWMDMWESPMPSKAHRWAGALTLPRELTLAADGSVRMNPARELAALRRGSQTLSAQTLTNQHLPLTNDMQELILTLRPADSDAERYGLAIGSAARLFVDNQSHRLVLERFNEHPALCTCRSVPLPEGDILSLRIFIDRSSLEIFVNQGQACLTSRIYPTAGDRRLSLFAEGDGRCSSPSRDGSWQASGVMGMSTGRVATPPVRLQRTTFQQRARHFHRITLFPPLNHMQRRKATQFIMRQLHRRQCRQEQLAGADHIVVAQHRHLLRYPPTLRQQYLIRQKRYPIVPTHHDIAIAPAGGKMPLQQRYAVAIALIAGAQIEMILPQLFNIAPRFAPGAFQTAAAQPRRQRIRR